MASSRLTELRLAGQNAEGTLGVPSNQFVLLVELTGFEPVTS